jgi:hypothetical protein
LEGEREVDDVFLLLGLRLSSTVVREGVVEEATVLLDFTGEGGIDVTSVGVSSVGAEAEGFRGDLRNSGVNAKDPTRERKAVRELDCAPVDSSSNGSMDYKLHKLCA